MTIKNAKIIGTQLGKQRGIPTCSITLAYDENSRQAFGGYDLRHWGYGFIQKILDTVEVSQWEDLPGNYIRVDVDFPRIIGIGNILKDKWFYPAETQVEGSIRLTTKEL